MSVSVVLLGGELNAEMEHHRDRSRHYDRMPLPMALRGAEMADTLGAAQK